MRSLKEQREKLLQAKLEEMADFVDEKRKNKEKRRRMSYF